MRRSLLIALLVLASVSATAPAYWSAGGSGSGLLSLATLPQGPTPTAAGTAQAITVDFAQVTFRGAPLGTRPNGGYRVLRRPAAGGAAVDAGGTCAGTLQGGAGTLSCVDAGVPLGTWRYAVVPVLGSWTGDESAPGNAVVSRLPAPVFDAASPLDPAAGENVGAVRLTWQPVSGATGYRVERRTGAGGFTVVSGPGLLTATTWDDTTVVAGSTYDYVVRAAAADPGEASAPRSATPIVRPAAPGTPTATAGPGARVDVTWGPVAGATGYAVYRRDAGGAYPATPTATVAGPSYADTAAVHGTSYRYVVRALGPGAGATPVESAASPESALVTADGVAPAAPLTVTVGAGAGPLLAAATCGRAAGTRFVNAAGRAAVPVSVTLAAPEPGQLVELRASTPGGTPVVTQVPASGATVSAALNLSALPDGTVTLTAASLDAVGNPSSATAVTGPVVLDTVAALGSLVYVDNKGIDKLDGASECGASIMVEEQVPRVRTFGPQLVGATGTFAGMSLDTVKGGVAYSYEVTATDLAANATMLVVSGVAVR